MDKPIIFVSGTGRSGTHLVGRTISSNPAIEGRIEEPSTFSLITAIATTQDYRWKWQTNSLKRKLINSLNAEINNTEKIILEKSHPSLWLIDFLKNKYPNAKFIGVYRDLEPTVNSMLQHKGVLHWFQHLPLTKPNRFIGITRENKKIYKNLPLEEKCALRWKSHYNELVKQSNKYPDDVYLLKYDDFLVNPTPILKELSNFLGIENNFEAEEFKITSLDKWKKQLDSKTLKQIREAIHKY